MLNVCCVMQGDYEGRGADYVERLHDMVRRNLAAGFPGRFVCFTDRPEALRHIAGVELRSLPPQLRGWWAKLYLFSKVAFIPGERVLYFDLDVLILGPIDAIADYVGPFAGLRDTPRGRDQLQSSVMAWEAGRCAHIWENWLKAGKPEVSGGDQVWIQQRHAKPAWLQDLYPGAFRSFKSECIGGPPAGTRVVFFHGLPRPHEAGGWVDEIWKVGGGSSFELVGVGTVAQEKVLENIADAIRVGYPVLEPGNAIAATAIICAGGPSLAEQLLLIAQMQSAGAAVFSCNAVDGFLRERDIVPNFHVMLDARPDLARWVHLGGAKLYASMCDPEVLQAATRAGDLTVWHPITDGIEKLVTKGLIIGGGTTVGVRAIVLAYAMGFRNILCLGFDSCYAESGKHHAYPQSLNDGERVLDVVCNGRKFRAAGWMVQQAEDFKRLTTNLVRERGCSITVLGDGLIAAMTHLAAAQHEQAQATGYVEIEGTLWPAEDRDASPAVFGTLTDLERYIAACPVRRLAVQAGGNVGIWPRELARHFDRVVTFEPDPRNFHCLTHNCTTGNIAAYEAALGAEPALAGLDREPGNCGATRLAGEGTVNVITLDSLALDHCDLLQLDVEGYELQALQGAQETIARCAPLIVLELKGHGERYGYTDSEVVAWLAARGYEAVGTAHRDVMFRRKENGTRAA